MAGDGQIGPLAMSRGKMHASEIAMAPRRYAFSYTTPVAYSTDGDRLIIAASKGGGRTNPDWYFNLLAHPTVTDGSAGLAHPPVRGCGGRLLRAGRIY